MYFRNDLPDYFVSFFDLSSNITGRISRNCYDLYVVRYRSNNFKRSFKLQCVSLWNNLPNCLKSINSPRTFNQKLKVYLCQ